MLNNKSLKLLDAIGSAEDKYISEAASHKTKRKWYTSPAFLSSAAACICVAAVSGIAVGVMYSVKPADDTQSSTNLYESENVAGSNVETNETVVEVDDWNSLTVEKQYTELDFGEHPYSALCKELGRETDKALGEYTITGFDFYEDKTHTAKAEVFSIDGISAEYAVAAKLSDGKYYVYSNAYYTPDTLGRFAEDLSLSELLTVGRITSDAEMIISDSCYKEFYYNGLTTEKVMELLFNDKSIACTNRTPADDMSDKRVMSFSIGIPSIGINNIAMWLTEDGYLCTNLLSDMKCFEIGKEKVQAFCDYAKTELEKSSKEFQSSIKPGEPETSGGEYGTESGTLHYDVQTGIETYIPE